jgi:hypothetical protein
MNKITEIKNRIADLNTQITSAKKELTELFNIELPAFILSKVSAVEGYTLESVYIYINNHEFNDGDATYFSFNYDDMTVTFTDSIGEEYEVESYAKVNPELLKTRTDIIDFFSSFDANDFYELRFGESYERVKVKVSNGKVTIED